MRKVREQTRYVAGLDVSSGMAGGDPSPWTALGIFASMKATLRHVLHTDLRGATVAVQGIGNVGGSLCRLVKQEGARLVIADIDDARAAAFAGELGTRQVDIDEILAFDADILAPCALGGILNDATIPSVWARLVCGGANNQLATDADGQALFNRASSMRRVTS